MELMSPLMRIQAHHVRWSKGPVRSQRDPAASGRENENGPCRQHWDFQPGMPAVTRSRGQIERVMGCDCDARKEAGGGGQVNGLNGYCGVVQ
jgi:hypothetical protein